MVSSDDKREVAIHSYAVRSLAEAYKGNTFIAKSLLASVWRHPEHRGALRRWFSAFGLTQFNSLTIAKHQRTVLLDASCKIVLPMPLLVSREMVQFAVNRLFDGSFDIQDAQSELKRSIPKEAFLPFKLGTGEGIPVPKSKEAAAIENELLLLESLEVSEGDSDRSIKERFNGSESASRHTSQVTVFDRDRVIKEYVRERASGKCELCGEIGFVDRSGNCYLETHHVIPLSEGGADEIWNVVALCANDHRRAHYGIDAADIKYRLIKILANLYPEGMNRASIYMENNFQNLD